MRKRIAMVLLGLSLAVGTPAATNMFPTVSAQTVQAAGKTGWTQESGTWYFYKDGVKQTTGYTATTGAITFTSNVTEGTNVAAMYELAESASDLE